MLLLWLIVNFGCCKYLHFSVTDESILLDLKHLLIEAKQKVPEFLASLQSENEQYLNIGGKYMYCVFCIPAVFICITAASSTIVAGLYFFTHPPYQLISFHWANLLPDDTDAQW